jgi:hypothetical protein
MNWLRLPLWLALVACGSSPPQKDADFPAQPLMTLTSDSGHLRVEVRTSPQQPPTRGISRVEFVVRDAATSETRSGLTLDTVTWMPAHNHGASVVPTVAETAPGTYVLSDVDFFMSGTWELVTNISPNSDHVAPSFQIP